MDTARIRELLDQRDAIDKELAELVSQPDKPKRTWTRRKQEEPVVV